MNEKDLYYHRIINKETIGEYRVLFSRHYMMPGKTSPMDCHTAFEVSMFTGGCTYRINDEDYSVSENDIVLMQNNVSHAITDVRTEGFFYNFYFEPQFVWDNMGVFDKKYLGIFMGSQKNFKPVLDRNNPGFPRVLEIYKRIIAECEAQQDGYEHMAKALLMELLITISRYFDYKCDEISIEPHNVQAISRAVQYINTHFAEEITLESIAKEANLSPSYFGLIFKKLNGITPWEYVMSSRIKYATTKIRGGDYTSIIELAESCGFNNIANFNRIFKKYTGKVPSKYIENAQKD